MMHGTKNGRKTKGRMQSTLFKLSAKLIMADIREKQYDVSNDPTHEDIVHPIEKMWLPQSLQSFLQMLLKSELKQQSIGRSIVLAARPRSVIPPGPFGLAVEMGHVFGSKWLITELSRLGFSVSYDEVTRFKESVIADTDGTEIARIVS